MQQALELPIPQQKNYGNWVRHPNAEEASSRVALWLVRGGLLWLTSDDIAGKSHLLNAVFSEHSMVSTLKANQADLSSVQQLCAWMKECEFHAYWALDLPSGRLPKPLGLAVFHLIERAKEMDKALLISWRCEQQDMLPPELGSRMLMMDKVELMPPESDVDIQRVLKSVLDTMQWDMKDSVLPTLVEYIPRHLSTLLAAINTLDQYSKTSGKKMNGTLALKVLGVKT